MKRNAFMPVVLAVLFLSAISCSKDKLHVFNWSYYTPESVVKQFEKEFNVRVVIDEYASNEEMFAKLKSGGNGYDIVFPTQDYVAIMIRQGMVEKINHSLIPNLKNIDPVVLRKASYDSGMEYSVPYYWGATGVIVNTARVPDYRKSWSIFGRQDLRGRMTLLDDMREVMGNALTFLGYSINSKNPAEIEEAKNYINNNWKPNIIKFDAEAFGKGYANGEFWVVHAYPEVVYEEILDDEQLLNSTVFFIPEEGGSGYIDSMCILKGAKNIELAHKFIDFIHRPEIYAEFCDDFGFPASVNIPARRHIHGPSWYSMEDILDAELKFDLGDALELYNDAWYNSIRAGK